MEDDGKTQVNYKHAASDPLYETHQKHLVASLWGHPVINRPLAATFGLTGVGGIYTSHGGAAPRASGGYIVYRPKHWAFEGTDLYFGDQFGQQPVGIVAFEVDGLDYTFRDGLPFPTYKDGANNSTEILALVPAIKGEEDHSEGGLRGRFLNAPLEEFKGIADVPEDVWQSYLEQADDILPETGLAKGVLSYYGCSAVVSLKYGKGEVFNAGTCTWVHGLFLDDFFTQQITRNVLNRFSKAG